MDSGIHTDNRTAVVTDSTADVPDNLCRALGIHVVPNIIMIGDETLEDGVDITREEFYTRLVTSKYVTTGTASPIKYQQVYEKLLGSGFHHIISIHAASLLSGIFNAASLAAQSFAGRITVIDSQQLTLGLGFQVIAAAEQALHGVSPQQILVQLEDVRRRVRVVAMLDTLEYVRRSGRVSWARARMGELLRIKPFIEVQSGQVRSLGEARTAQKGLHRLKDMLVAQGPLERLAILHTNAEGQARQFLSLLPTSPIDPLIVNVTTVIGTHTGPNGIGFSVVLAGA
jgi:DegV family protein with EDD domain